MAADPNDDTLMRRFLIDLVTPEERTSVEDRLADSEAFAEALAAIEDELIVQYLQGTLPAQWEDPFKRAFLETADGQAQVKQMAALRGLLVARRAPERPAHPESRWPAARLGWVAAAAVLLAGSVWYLNRTVPQSDPIAAPPPRIASFMLTPGLSRSDAPAMNVFRVEPDIQTIQLRLDVDAPGPAAAIHTSLRLVGGSTMSIAIAPDVQRDGSQLRVTWSLPVSQLPPGDYLLSVIAGTAADAGPTIASRFFSITP